MFVDKIRIEVQAGKGGDGSLSFRREKYIPMGGPNGGNGGRGGDVYLQADRNMTTLLDLTYKPHFKAQEGAPGESWDKAGKSGEDLVVRVPVGTVVLRDGQVIADLKDDGQQFLAAQGGRGGRGNSSFKTIRNTAPRIAEKGEPGELLILELELKLIADVGLVGSPNAGKSTLLSRISSAKPKIADYPFTTLSPNLGVAKLKNRSFVVADIPGLIEGAHEGKGLGMEFLRHVERTRILVHLVDPMGFDGKTPAQDYKAIQKELALYSKKLAKKPIIPVMTKMDLTDAEEIRKKFQKQIKAKKVLGISAVTGQGLPELLTAIVKKLDTVKDEPEEEVTTPEVKRYVFEDEFHVERLDGGFRVRGKKVERLQAMTNFDQPQAVERFQNILKKMGVERMLQKQGIQPGDMVYIGTMEFAYADPASAADGRES